MDNAPAIADSAFEARTLPVDVEHLGIRIALPLIAIAAGLACHALIYDLSARLGPVGLEGCLALIGAAVGGLAFTALADRLLKRIWPSARFLRLDEAAVSLHDRRRGRPALVRIAWEGRVNVLTWRFTVKRGSARVPRGWVMLGCQLTQDEAQITLYSFVPEKVADDDTFGAFNQLVFRELLNKNELPLREANFQRRLMRAEDGRWEDGGELRSEDLRLLLRTLDARAPGWRDQR
jgi:hypothetical protein